MQTAIRLPANGRSAAKLLFELPQDRHVAPYPFDLALAVGGEHGVREDVRLH